MPRRWRTILVLVTLLAALGVLTRELPECVHLSDDVSNDGSVAVNLQQELLSKVLSPAAHAPPLRLNAPHEKALGVAGGTVALVRVGSLGTLAGLRVLQLGVQRK